MARHIKTKPRRPSEVRPDLAISGRLERLVMRLLEKDCERRPQSALALIEELKHCQLAREREFSLIKGAALRARRRALLFALAVVGAVAVFGAVAGVATSMAQGEGSGPTVPVEPAVAILSPKVTVAPPAVPPAEKRVDLTLDSEPTGAVVLRDGRLIGVTPLVVAETPGTSLELTFERAGYQPRREVVTVSAARSSLVVGLSRLESPGAPPPRDRRVAGASPPPSRGRRPRADGKAVSDESARPPAAPPTAPGEAQGRRPPTLRYGRLDDR